LQTYRLFLRSHEGVIIGRADLSDAEDDGTALALANHLFNACCDLAANFELWHGPRLVATSYARHPQVTDGGSINAETQARVAQHEEALLDSNWTIAQSKQLLERTRRPRGTT
jgi:hypothetical protein